MANDFFKYQIDKSGLNIDDNITNYVADIYADTLFPSDTNSSGQDYVPKFQSKFITDSLINYIVDNADDPMNDNLPPAWKTVAKQQFSEK